MTKFRSRTKIFERTVPAGSSPLKPLKRFNPITIAAIPIEWAAFPNKEWNISKRGRIFAALSGRMRPNNKKIEIEPNNKKSDQ